MSASTTLTQIPRDNQAASTEVLELREHVEVETLETIPLPRARIQNRQAFAVIVDDMTAWPDQTLTWRFEYNDYSGHWIFECEHPSMGKLFHARQRAVLGRAYSHYPFFMARFTPRKRPESPDGPSRVTPQNLGERVFLTVSPGPAGGSFLDSANVTDAEEDALLGRYASDYPVTKEWVE